VTGLDIGVAKRWWHGSNKHKNKIIEECNVLFYFTIYFNNVFIHTNFNIGVFIHFLN